MAGCMRYCTLSMKARMPRLSMRSNRLTPSPAASASRLMIVGGSCFWSPISTTWLQPLVRGTHTAGSVACVASSMRHAWKLKRSRMSLPAPAHVAQITSARRSTPLMAWYCWSLLQLHPGSMPAMLSTMYCMRSWRTASGRPMRATRTPARDKPSTRLSTAMLLSEVHRMGHVRERSHICTSATAVWVLPVPGGPWISVTRWNRAASSASVWLLFMWLMACRSMA
mmetsp:Transcript_37482/g.92752  ORF Transcript_37482/g.92752 Transcript_37482/m.92752 type:complete len:225 (+) Transcript_37482:1402-2076(+)